LLNEAPKLRRRLLRWGFTSADVDELMADIVSVAWTESQRGYFCPDPTVARAAMLTGWMRAITWRVAVSLIRSRARYREVLSEAEELHEHAQCDPGDQLDAREALALLRNVTDAKRVVVEAVAMGEGIRAIADATDTIESTVWSRLRSGRADFLKALRRANLRRK
jgi:DNA-directed RNA polymerase specialized sigma24 family protein